MCLVARHFETRGLPTLILGSGLDIMQAGRPPRATFLNYPLGFEAGIPFDEDNQLAVLSAAVAAFDRMDSAGFETLDFNWQAGWEMINRRNRESTGTDQRSPRNTEPRYQTVKDRVLAEANIASTP